MSFAHHGATLVSALLFPLINLLASGALAQEQEPGIRSAPPSTTAYPLERRPVIDGDVADDAAWQGVMPATGFRQVRPDEGRPATQRTEVRVGYTDEALYIGLIAYETDPSMIIVTDSRRDSSLDQTDSFRVLIDGMLDRQNGFVFGTNPAGLQYDAQVTNEGSRGFNAVGPVLYKDADYKNIQITGRHNGEVAQSENSSDLIFGMEEMVSYISRYFTLEPGDMIWSGTMGSTRAMVPGDVYEVELSGIGVLRNEVVQGN